MITKTDLQPDEVLLLPASRPGLPLEGTWRVTPRLADSIRVIAKVQRGRVIDAAWVRGWRAIRGGRIEFDIDRDEGIPALLTVFPGPRRLRGPARLSAVL